MVPMDFRRDLLLSAPGLEVHFPAWRASRKAEKGDVAEVQAEAEAEAEVQAEASAELQAEAEAEVQAGAEAEVQGEA